MSEYSELIMRFDKIRDYMRDFYVYGFMSREDFADKKSLRTYDNEKRRIESYLSEYMSFRIDENGKSVFISVDSSEISANPLYRAFKAKTFTKNDITLNFIILDILYGGVAASVNEIADKITSEYLCFFDDPVILDVSTIRIKLSKYLKLGILTTRKQGKKLLYSLEETEIDLACICDAMMFFSETSPLGVVGSYLLDKCIYDNKLMSFKHHYIMHALESEIVYELLEAIHSKQKVNLINHSNRSAKAMSIEVIPLRIMISVQGGRRYLAAYCIKPRAIISYRLDYIKTVKHLEACEEEFNTYSDRLDEILSHTWGASFGRGNNIEHLSMLLHISHNEQYMIDRIMREGRHGTLLKVDDTTYSYEILVYDAMEMVPWLRTFIGRIISIECDNEAVVRTFYKDFDTLYSYYGID